MAAFARLVEERTREMQQGSSFRDHSSEDAHKAFRVRVTSLVSVLDAMILDYYQDDVFANAMGIRCQTRRYSDAPSPLYGDYEPPAIPSVQVRAFDREGREGELWVEGIEGEIWFFVFESGEVMMRLKPRPGLIYRDPTFRCILKGGSLADADEILMMGCDLLIDYLAKVHLTYGSQVLRPDVLSPTEDDFLQPKRRVRQRRSSVATPH
jgi:hypothetical protein